MAQETSGSEDNEQKLDELIATIFAAIDAGQHLDPEEWIRRSPEFAGELKEFFADLGMCGRLREQFGPTGAPDSTDTASSGRHAEGIVRTSTLIGPGQDQVCASREQFGPTGALESTVTASSGRHAEGIDQTSTLIGPGQDQVCEGAIDSLGRYSFGRYSLLKLIGEGGQGEVWKALQSNPSRFVALKMIRGGYLASADEVRRFREEAELVASLDHPHIVPVYEVGDCQGRHFFSMKLMAGGNLTDRLSTYRDQPKAIAALMIQLAEAVHHAHQHRIIHRDLKPSNIVFDAKGQAHLTDFGLAKRTGGTVEVTVEVTVTGSIVGTAAYMSPEQASGQKGAVTTLSDVYGLGAVLYSLLTGRAPFVGKTVTDILVQVRERAPDSPSKIQTKVPRDLQTICLKCLDKNSNRRYQSAQEVVDDLTRWREGRPIKARPVGQVERFGKWCRRRPGLAASLASLLFVAILGITGIIWQWQRAEGQWQRAEQQTEILRWTLYRSQVAGAYREYEAGHTGQALALLDRCDKRLRGWEWDYLQGRRYREPLILTHGSGSYDIAFGRGGPCLASAGDDHSVNVWDAATGKALFPPLRGHRAEVRGVVFSSDGQLLASASWDETVKVWDVSTGELIRTLNDHQGSAICVAFSPDGSRLAYGSGDGVVLVYDVKTGRCLDNGLIQAHPKDMCVFGLAYSPDGRWLVSVCDDGEIKVWDAVTHRLDRQLRGGNLDSIRGVAFSPDGRRLCAACADGTILLWDLPDWRLTRTLTGHFNTVRAVAFSPDGFRLASASDDRTVKVWDVATGDEVLTFHGHDNVVRAVAFSPDGRLLASADEDGQVIVRDATSSGAGCEAIRVISGHDQVSWGVACDPHGRRIAGGGADRVIRVWDYATGLKLLELPGHTYHVFGLAFSPDGRLLASASDDGSVRIWDARAGKLLGTSPPGPSAGGAWAVAFSPDGRVLASAWGDGTVKLWTLSAGGTVDWGSARILSGSQDRVLSVAFSPDGAFLVSAGEDKIIRIWDVKSGRERHGLFPQEHTGKIYCVAFNRDGTCLASASRDRTIRIWDMGTGKRLGPVLSHTEMLECVAFSPDGRYFVGAGGDGAVRVWDASNYQEVVTLYGHIGRIVCLAFTSDGSRLVSSGLDKTIRVWDASCWSTIPRRPSRPGPTVVWH